MSKPATESSSPEPCTVPWGQTEMQHDVTCCTFTIQHCEIENQNNFLVHA